MQNLISGISGSQQQQLIKSLSTIGKELLSMSEILQTNFNNQETSVNTKPQNVETVVDSVTPAVKPHAKKVKKPVDPLAPKAPISAYLLFMADKRNQLKISNPEISNNTIFQELGQMWSCLSAEEKKPYSDKYEISKAEYNKKLELYRASKVSGASNVVESNLSMNKQPETVEPETPVSKSTLYFSDLTESPVSDKKKKKKKRERGDENEDPMPQQVDQTAQKKKKKKAAVLSVESSVA